MRQNKVSLCAKIKYNKGCFWAIEVIERIILESYINARIKTQKLKDNGHDKIVKIYILHTDGLSSYIDNIRSRIKSIDQSFIVVSRKR
jgi:hypothetical protein